MKQLYNEILAKEWIDWVETPDPQGTREREFFPFLKKWIGEVNPKMLLDIGCGQGACSDVVDDTIQYIGIDSSPILLARARKLYPSSNKEFIEGDAYHIPVEKESVDVALSIWVWSHLSDLGSTAKEMFRVLKSHGKFLIVTANPETYEERKTFYKNYAIKDNVLTGTFDLGGGKTLTDTTLCLHSKDQIYQAIEQAGLTIEYTRKMGQAESSAEGLYLAIEGSK